MHVCGVLKMLVHGACGCIIVLTQPFSVPLLLGTDPVSYTCDCMLAHACVCIIL